MKFLMNRKNSVLRIIQRTIWPLKLLLIIWKNSNNCRADIITGDGIETMKWYLKKSTLDVRLKLQDKGEPKGQT